MAGTVQPGSGSTLASPSLSRWRLTVCLVADNDDDDNWSRSRLVDPRMAAAVVPAAGVDFSSNRQLGLGSCLEN